MKTFLTAYVPWRLGVTVVAMLAVSQHALTEPPQVSVTSTATPLKGRTLVWGDEFNQDGPPDPAKWRHERGFVRNRELQWYRPENAACHDGRLVIEARRERLANPNFVAGSTDWARAREEAEYTSSCVKTNGLFSWRYGTMEVRARIDARPGLWPAIWTIGDEGSWPGCGEVDVMEYYDGSLLANACWRAQRGVAAPEGVTRRGHVLWDAIRRPLAEFGDDRWAEAFHLWTMDWNERQIRLSVDGQLLNEIDLDAVQVRAGEPHPFRQPHHLLLNLAVGGDQGGDPGPTEFPARFEVDYVRVYSLSEAVEPQDSGP